MALGLIVDIIGDPTKLDNALDKSKGSVGGFGDMLGGSAIKIAAVAGVAAVAGAAIIGMTEAAAADRDEQAKLAAAIDAAGAATATSTAQVDAAIAAGQERAFTDSMTRDALQSLVTATGDVTLATGLLTGAQDIARLAGVDLATAADAVAKAQVGQDGPLRKLIPGLEKGATATETLANATAAAAGQADLYASSSAGMSARTSDAFGELGEQLGSVFLPILDALMPALIAIIKALGTLVSAILPVLIPLVKVLASVVGIVAGVFATLVGWLAKLVDWLVKAIGMVGDFLAAINPLKGISLPSLPFIGGNAAASSAAGGLGRSTRASSSPAAGPVNVTIYTTGDGIEAEQAVVRALRRTRRLNGGVIPALGWASQGV